MKSANRAMIAALSFLAVLPLSAENAGTAVNVVSGGKAYASYLAAASGAGKKPAILLIHSFNGLEQGYKDMADAMAADGFVVLEIGWQTFERSPSDAVVSDLVRDGISLLRDRQDVDAKRLGLTGFCAGGRYTMLFLPVFAEFAAGVAWYGFPENGGSAAQPVKPIEEVGGLQRPLLMIHGSADRASPIAGIYRYAQALDQAGKYYELKVYQGLPHGFMVQDGRLSKTEAALDAYREMIDFFKRKLGA
jgi:carboxymethylenebutenolidase